MTSEEKTIYEKVTCLHHKYWLPIQWCCTLLCKGRNEKMITSDILLNDVLEEIMKYRHHLMMLLNYDWISVPLVYTQVVTIAVYGFFAVTLMGRQYLDVSKKYAGHDIDLYVPIFTILQFIFYMGWLKVAETLINPLGEDDDDYEVNFLIDRHMKAGYLMVDDNYKSDNPQIGSASGIE
ncbi:unnamed protein product [Soboliphyme baturini]|uniref:Bestrophin homolog n=1 Tax=Soboliphyme baturini TaxID=241478 RepID=A0A183J764_9BILA|nr:unnamed protein product [Soboliphyme baturini]